MRSKDPTRSSGLYTLQASDHTSDIILRRNQLWPFGSTVVTLTNVEKFDIIGVEAIAITDDTAVVVDNKVVLGAGVVEVSSMSASFKRGNIRVAELMACPTMAHERNDFLRFTQLWIRYAARAPVVKPTL